MVKFHWKSNFLLRRTVVYIFICACCLSVSSVTFEFYSTYQQEIQRLKNSLDQIEQTQVETLSNKAWILDNASIQIQLQSLVLHPDIIYLEFVNTQNVKISAGEKQESLENILSRTIPLHFIDDGDRISLGTFNLQASTEPTKNILYQRIPLIALFESIKIFTLCGLVIWIIYSLFSRHLSHIAKYTNTLDINKLQSRLTLQRKETQGTETDELTQITQAINEMQDRIQEGLYQKQQAETALRKKEELLQFATEGASLGVWDWNMETNETYFNSIYLTMLGYEADELPHTYATWHDLTHPDDRNMVKNEIGRCVSEEKPWEIKFRLRTKSGQYKWILGSGKVVEKNEVGVPVRATGIHLDISESQSLEDERQKVLKLESVGVLAGGIAHDFNNILAAILGNIELASLRIVEDEKLRSLLSNAQKATKRATKLTQQLLTFSKGGEPIKEATPLSELVKESADFVLHGSQVSCEYEFTDTLWLVDADIGQIGQVIQNIALNGIHSMPKGGSLKISCRNISNEASKNVLNKSEGKFVCISIQDTGSGIPLDIQDKIFDPYYTTKQEGSGLGLAVCHSIIAKHGGYISVDSPLGKGTTFSIYLPAVTATNVTNKKEQHTTTAHQSAKIMVMDDDEMIRNVAREQLSILGHQTVLVINGEQAITTFQELQKSNNPIDLVIMDLTIPGGMGGQEAAQKLLKVAPGTKIIVASGYSNDPVMANYHEHGFCAAIAKPFNFQELGSTIASIL